MKIKINEKGYLEIERAGKFKKQYCPYQQDPDDQIPTPCGDWCPLFGSAKRIGGRDNPPFYSLDICHKTFEFPEQWFTDERGFK